MEYDVDEKKRIIKKYLEKYAVPTADSVIEKMHDKVDAVPREIHNFCIKVRDFFVTK